MLQPSSLESKDEEQSIFAFRPLHLSTLPAFLVSKNEVYLFEGFVPITTSSISVSIECLVGSPASKFYHHDMKSTFARGLIVDSAQSSLTALDMILLTALKIAMMPSGHQPFPNVLGLCT